ncbi:hypothetical protein DYZ85_02471 [Listeria monocytogenes]|nr:hypothetical protein DYZ85_02471 [Listeria monocytogenes]
MNRYKILGEYKDWCEIYKDGTVIHNGSSLGIVGQVESELCLRLNYGTNKHFYSILKKCGSYQIRSIKTISMKWKCRKILLIIFYSFLTMSMIYLV